MKNSPVNSAEASSDVISTAATKESVNALCTCRICGELIIIISDGWSNSIKNSTGAAVVSRWRRPADVINSHRLLEYKIGEKTWPHKEIFDEICQKCKSSNINSPFPLCNSCCSILLQRVKSKIQFFHTSDQLFMRLDIKDKEVFKQKMLSEIERINAETSAFSEAKTAYEQEAVRITKFGRKRKVSNGSYLMTQQLTDLMEKESPLVEEQERVELILRQTPKVAVCSFSSLTLCVVFHIGIDRLYGTINCMRLGQTYGRTITYDEINIGFVFLAQLVKSICKIGSIDSSSIKYGVTVSIDGLELNANDMSSRRGVKRFNAANFKFFEFCKQLFDSQVIRDNLMTPPVTIELEKQLIGEIPFSFEYSDPSNWTSAMKLLLLDFKSIQMKAMQISMFIQRKEE